jgi:thiamine-phosphate pyrophosphorylase
LIRCLITDGSAARDERRWLEHLARWVNQGVDLIQIRERDLSARDLADLTRRLLAICEHRTKVLVNDRADVAIACGADGVHLRDGCEVSKFRRPGFLISASCHNSATAALFAAADYVLLAPIFSPLSKSAEAPPLGTEAIREFTRRSSVPVLALGGITDQNAAACMEAGAAGIAGITYFAS